MPDPQSLFVYTFLFVPLFGMVVFLWYRCINNFFETQEPSVYIVEPIQVVQRIHAIEPLAIAESVQTELDDDAQFALTLHSVPSVPLPHHGSNQETLYI